jgi:homopolymeric O-antigen transport system ATP-binding protein
MDSEVSVRVDGVSKLYRIGALQQHISIREHLVAMGAGSMRRIRHPRAARGEPKPTIWALRDVSLDVNRGDVLGIVGRNGAGKTTLLKILSRITHPTEGMIEIRGRVGSLLEVGTGFHFELTGRENVYLNGAILGMRKAEIARKFDDIVEFAEIGDFIDTPVKRYSSGMYVRLAFAVAAHLEPEILVVDEVLAVGDTAFQKKCIGKMGDVARSGRTVLFVSHNMGAVAELCNRAILLEKGRKIADGSVTTVFDEYTRILGDREHEIGFAEVPGLPVSIVSCRVERRSGTPATSFDIADDVALVVRYVTRESLNGLQLTITLARNMVDLLHTFDTDNLPEIPIRPSGTYEARCVIPGSFLKAGLYTVRVTTGTPQQMFQDLFGAISFEVEELTVNTQMKGYRKDRPGLVIAPVEWETSAVGEMPMKANAATR